MRLTLAVLIYFGIELYFYKRVKNSFRNAFPNYSEKKLKKILRAIFVFINIYPLLLVLYFLYLMITGSPRWNPVDHFLFDWLLVYPFWVSVLIIVQSIVFLIPIDLIRLVLFPLYKKKKESVKKVISYAVVTIVFASVVYVSARVAYDYSSVSVRITELEVENLPKALEGFKITFISDTQSDRYTDSARLNYFIKMANQTNPDLVLMAGDVITGTPNYIDVAANALGELEAEYGIYSCVGDHDNWAYRDDNARSLREITTALNEKNVKMVDNDTRTIQIDTASINIAFATYTYSRRITEEDLRILSNGNGEHDVDIFLTHQPNEFMVEFAEESNYDLFLAGHTHGGQLTILFPFFNLTPTLMETKYVKGDFFLDDMKIIITRGLGMSIAPIRYNSTPEVTVIVLQNKD